MKKATKYLVIIIILGVILGAGIPISYVYFFKGSNVRPRHVRIYVNSTIYTSLSTEISQYRQDVIDQGYSVETVNWSNNNVTVLRNDLINASNQAQGLEGAVLIGDLPSAMMQYNYYGLKTYPIDLYLTDLDGEWIDLDLADELFDAHNNGTGDIYPEIWIGRICPESLNNTNHLSAYQNYFARNHAYRTGQLNQPHSQLVYIDNDWATSQSLVDEWMG
ncbi:MAG: C25 family cysteine peptidase, partial [Promethearchaeota archaeon]